MKKRNKFSLSHQRLLSCDMGYIVPIANVEVLPGDTLQQATSALLRCSPLLTPVMHPVHVDIRHFYVPNRLIWEDFDDFITGGPDGLDASVAPTIDMGAGAAVGSLADYLGVPTGVAGLDVSALPFRAYNLIYNEFFRDQDLQTELVNSIASGVDTTSNTTLMRAAWQKDYFTAARPWEQKGASITIPLGVSAPIAGIGITGGGTAVTSAVTARQSSPLANEAWSNATSASVFFKTDGAASATQKPQIYADLSGASAITINALREALATQRYEEARARYGSRMTEYLRYLGVRASDARLQRPEYLGGGRNTVQFSEVLQTAEGADPVGTLRGHGIAAMRSNRYRRFFEEHGYVISVLIVRPTTIYMDGLPRAFSRDVKEKYWQPEFEHIGQQEILNKEVRAAHATPNGVFGYQDRYDEYRGMVSGVSGEFRTTLNMWHFARAFGSDPALNSTFVQCVPPETPFAVPSEHVLWITARHSIQARRLLSKVGTSFIF